MTALLCAAASAFAFYFSTGLGGTVATSPGFLWAVALLAPVPLLWYAFRATSKGWAVFAAAFGAMLTGMANMLPVYLGTLPPAVLVLGMATPALGFALAVLGARFVAQRVARVTAVFAFAALWTSFDFLLSQDVSGAAASPGYSQVEMPAMIQIASVFGVWSITAVMGLFAAAAAMAFVTRKAGFAFFAVAVLTVNIGYGVWRMQSAPKTAALHVGLAGSDALVPEGLKNSEASALKTVKAYAAAGKSLAQNDVIVFPEKLAVLDPAWTGPVNAELETLAHISHALVVAGFDVRGVTRQNNALVYFPNGSEPQSYTKRHLVPGLESSYEPGSKSFMLGDRTGVAICKDMDFPTTLRADAILGPNFYAVPAWDFDGDAVWHARIAILRGVENGFAVARAANNGLLTLSDAYGRVVAVKSTAAGRMVTLEGTLPRGPGATLYGVIGDSLAYIALGMSVMLLGVAGLAGWRRERRR